MNRTPYITCILVLIILIGLAGMSGCGQKGPPVAPVKKSIAIAAPYDLKLTNIGQDMHLVWKHKTDEQTAAVKPETFEIFMAKKSFEECEGCPVEFRIAGKMDASVMEFFVPVTPGFKYYFRIQATDDDELRSPYSKTVQLDFK